MRFSPSLKGHFLFPGFKFPDHLSCAYIFNKVFVDGNSYNDIHYFATNKTSSILQLNTHGDKPLIQYNLKKDIWGSKEILVLSKDGTLDNIVAICYGCRKKLEWDYAVNFLEGHNSVILHEERPGNRTYQFKFPKDSEDTRIVVINVLREHEQSVKVTLSLNY